MEFSYNEIDNLLLEGRLEDVRKKYPNIVDSDFDILVSIDPSGNQKYLNWLGKIINHIISTSPNPYQVLDNEGSEHLKHILHYFHENQQSFDKRDINQYKTFVELANEVEKVKIKKKEKQAKKEALTITNNSKHLIIVPKSYMASCTYGAGTKWCTTSKDSDRYYNEYTSAGDLIYVIRKGIPNDDRFYKIAFFVRHNGKLEIYDAPDKKVDVEVLLMYITEEEWDEIRMPIIDYLFNIGSEGVKGFLTTEEIKSYMESGDVNIFKLDNVTLMKTFQGETDLETLRNVYKYAQEKGYDLYNIRPNLVYKNLSFEEVITLYNEFNINIFNVLSNISDSNVEKTFLTKIFSTYSFDDILDMVSESTYGSLENFLRSKNYSERFITQIFGPFSKASRERINRFISYILHINTLSETPIELEEFLLYQDIIAYFKDSETTFADYLKNMGTLDMFFSSIDSVITPMTRNFPTLISLGFTPKELKSYIGEYISYRDLNLENLNIVFPNQPKRGIRFFFDEVRMDLWIMDMGNYSLTLDNLSGILGKDTFKFIEQELKELGSGIGGEEFNDEDQLTQYMYENFTAQELYEVFISRDDDFESYLNYLERYSLEPNQLQKIIIISEIGGDNEYVKKLEEEILNDISDVEKVGDEYILTTDGWLDFTYWMYDGRDCCKDQFEWFFSEDSHESFSDTIYNWQDDVWDMVISTDKVSYIREYLKQHYLGEEIIEPENGDYIELTSEVLDALSDSNLGWVIDKSDSLEDLHTDLGSAYHWSYNHAYEEEVSEDFISEIETILETKDTGQWVTERITKWDGSEFTMERLKFKIRSFWDVLLTYAQDNIEWKEELNYDNYIGIVGELIEDGGMEPLSIRIPDYPDWDKVKGQFKDMIHSYI
jgi:hypothetical protein